MPALVFAVMRRSSAARAAHREQARSYICFGPIIPGADARVPLALTSISWGTNRAVARRHRRHWPETNVGASLLAMRRAGGARSHRHYNPQGKLAPTFVSGQLFLGQTRASPWRSPRYRGVQTGRSRAQAQAILARNKCRSELARDAPRGRRSISKALKMSRSTTARPNHLPPLVILWWHPNKSC